MTELKPASAAPAWLGDAPHLLAAYLLTLPTTLIAAHVSASGELIAVLKLLCVAAFAWYAAAHLGKRSVPAGSRLAFAAASGLLWAVVLAMLMFRVVAMTPFNFGEAIASLYDVRRTLVQSLGPHGVALTLAAFGALLAICTAATWALFSVLPGRVRRFIPNAPAAVVCLGMLGYFGVSDLVYAAERLVLFPNSGFAHKYAPAPLVHDYSSVQIRPGDSVFVVQLESVSADALFDRAGEAGGFRARLRQPGLETLLQEGGGVLFPLFWANGMRTNRAWESILCGVSGNAGKALAGAPGQLDGKVCLPARLAEAGYATVFFYSYFDLDFYNFGLFAQQAGFQEVVYGPGLMAETDRRHAWGYDDCVFYDRAFDKLAQRPRNEAILAYLEVGMNHVPFDGSAKYPQAHPFRPAKSIAEAYLNSVAEQDHCLLEFWRRFRKLGRDDVHLFVIPDHAIAVMGVPQRVDGEFATWLAYVPPARRAVPGAGRTVHWPVPSQAQVLPTILELLGAPRLPRSFAFALRGEAAPADYDDCHMLANQGSRLIVRRNGQRFEYRLPEQQAALAGAEPVSLSLNAFQERFACR